MTAFVGEDVEYPLFIAGGKVNFQVTLENSMMISPKIRKQPSSRPSNTTFWYICKGCSIVHKDMCSAMFIAAFFVIARTSTKCPLTKECIRKMWYIYLTEYYTAEKTNDILNFAGKWMEQENIILSEVTQIQKDNYHMYYS